jgi:hypothetical protein
MKKYSKFIVALLTAGGVLAIGLADWSLTADEGWQVVVAFIGALGVYQVRNKSA